MERIKRNRIELKADYYEKEEKSKTVYIQSPVATVVANKRYYLPVDAEISDSLITGFRFLSNDEIVVDGVGFVGFSFMTDANMRLGVVSFIGKDDTDVISRYPIFATTNNVCGGYIRRVHMEITLDQSYLTNSISFAPPSARAVWPLVIYYRKRK